MPISAGAGTSRGVPDRDAAPPPEDVRSVAERAAGAAAPDAGVVGDPSPRAPSGAAPALDGGAEPDARAYDGPLLTVAAVARRLGIAPATLRTWDRRYGLGPSAHIAGSHRRYTPADLGRFAVMRRLTVEGVPPAEAARLALGDDPEGALAALAPPGQSPPSSSSGGHTHGPARPGGGRVVAMPRAEPHVRGLARAAMSLDSIACTDIILASLETHGVVDTWQELLVPVLTAVGERWAVTGQGVDVEHLLSECVLGVMRGSVATVRTVDETRPVLLACAEGEEHSLPVAVLGAALAERRVAARTLGARVPAAALAAAVRRSGPAAVFVWAQRPGTARAEQVEGLPSMRPAPQVVVGGGGWDPDNLPPGVQAATSLLDAVERLAAAAGR